MTKTAISVLQEMMIKLGQIPEYECIAQSGPQHMATFEYCCKVYGARVSATARSKKEAKQEAARRMLNLLYARGVSVPPSYARPPSPAPSSPEPPSDDKPLPNAGSAPPATVDARSYVALLKELCEQYRLGAAQYELVADAGPAHDRRFTMRAVLGGHQRCATATTKRSARQLAAEQLYKYLRENLASLTKDFVEEDALARAHEKAMERYIEEKTWRAPLDQRVADYHIDVDKINLGKKAIEATANAEDPIKTLQSVASALGLQVECSALDGNVSVVRVSPTSPPVVAAGSSPGEAHAAALRYLRRELTRPAGQPAARLQPV